MPRKPIIRCSDFPYHVVARSHNKQWFPLPITEMWHIYLPLLELVQKKCEAKISSFLLMSNHFHMTINTPNSNIDEVMYWIMKKSTLEVQKRANIINSIYGGRYKASLLNRRGYMINAYKYVIRNPVAAKLCKNVEDYPFSLCKYFGNTHNYEINLAEMLFIKEIFDGSRKDLLEWLNQSYNEEESRSIKLGLDRPIFKYAKNENTKKFIEPQIIHPRLKIFEKEDTFNALSPDLEPGT